MSEIDVPDQVIRLSVVDLALMAAARRGAPLPSELARKLVTILLAVAAGKGVTCTREDDESAAPPAPHLACAVRSLETARDSRDHKRFLTLQAQLARRGFNLDPLTPETYLLQHRGLTGVLHSLDAAQRFLDELGGAGA